MIRVQKFWAALCINESNLLLVRITVCIEPCLLFGWRTFIWWKNPPKCSSILVWLRNDGIFYLQAATQRTIDISTARFGAKDRGLRTCKPWTEQAGVLEAFLHEAAQNFLNIQDQNLKIINIAVDVLLKAYPMVTLSCRSNLSLYL